ncbi:uncharacterized protein LOC124405734 [Diprion similis]|uniref:uncharacterized protein LOC124405734 n=1 Tax=Diprion similis TaxID=362088 RepID=UPI001EF7C9B7|nr:uncharacterized protein LOC124405734 [Diprion similis]
MINKEKEATATAGSSAPNRENLTDDPPPPYTLYKPTMADEPPPPPLEPPALTSGNPPAVTTQVITGPGPQISENSPNYHLTSGESIKAACCIVLCWFWIPFAFCIDCCSRSYPQLRPKRYR